ncbi:uncharacterized protein P884DRAFT_260593 [Thermothelomyces heterothallicus CBS 202.75]|uniref:uncharacterized protein n=1 Tax=Thermothelomyces heterothallicus CBS 202.75 TaxID=1149848 RepID=UPI003743545C
MGNESSRPEQLEGRSRSLSPLPRDDQLSPDAADSLSALPSTMPASLRVAVEGSGPPGAPGSLAWHRRRRQARALSPELPRASPPSELSDNEHAADDQEFPLTAHAVSTEELSPPATQPTRVKSKRAKKSSEKKRKAELKEAAKAAHDEAVRVEAAIQDHKKRRHRSTAPSPFPPRDGEQATGDPEPDNELVEATSPRSQSQKHARLGKKYKGLDKEVTTGDGEEEATTVHGRSIFDLEGDDDAPSSARPQGKRPRRDSDSKTRKKRKSSRSSNLGLDDGLEAGRSEEPIDRLALEGTNADSQLDRGRGTEREGETDMTEAARSSSPVLEERISADGAARRASTTSNHGSQRSNSDSGYAEAEVQGTPQREHEGDALERRGSPQLGGDDHLAAGDEANQDDDGEISVASDSHSSPVASPTQNSPADANVSNGELNGDAVESAPSQHDSDTAVAPFESVAKTSSSRSSAKRKTKVPFFSRGEEENARTAAEPTQDVAAPQQESRRRPGAESPVPGEADPSDTARKPKPKKQKRRPEAETVVAANEPDAQAQPEGSRYRTGPLSQTEENQITRAMERFRENEGLTQQELNQVIHDNPKMSGRPIHRQLWATIQDACPTRPRRKLIEWCRQRYNNWAGRGTWTPEQDDELVDLVAKHGKKWSYIAGLINRYQKDVRDRWRNYLVCRDTVRTDAWSDGEEERFREVVEKAIEKIRQGVGKDSKKPAEALVNWLDISQAMGYTRSRLQCMEKWKRMRAAEPLPDTVPTVLPQGNSWRLEKAREDLRKITAEDKYRLMCAIRDSGVVTDAKINWKPIIKGTFQDVYERQALVVTWGRLRKAVPDWETKTTHDCAQYLCEMYENEGRFGSSEIAEAAEDEENAAVSAKKKRRNRKKVVRPTSTDDEIAPSLETATTGAQSNEAEIVPSTINEDNDSASREFLPKRGNKGGKRATDAPSERTGDAADRDVQTEESAPVELRTDPYSGKRPRQAEKEQSSELNSGQAELSPSIEAQAARFRRRERIGSTVERGSVKGKDKGKGRGKEFRPLGSETKASKFSKRQRRASLSDVEDIESPKPKKRKTLNSSSKAEADGIASPRTREDKAPESYGKSWSVISSDMDDMEDIPATLPVSSQAAH